MGELKFDRRDNKKYGTISITIRNGVLPLKENFEIIANEKNGSKLSKGYRATNSETMRYNRKMGGGNKRIFKNPRCGARKISVR